MPLMANQNVNRVRVKEFFAVKIHETRKTSLYLILDSLLPPFELSRSERDNTHAYWQGIVSGAKGGTDTTMPVDRALHGKSPSTPSIRTLVEDEGIGEAKCSSDFHSVTMAKTMSFRRV